MTRNERKLEAIEREKVRLADEVKAVWAKAEGEERETTADERGDVEAKLKDIETLKGDEKEVRAAIKVEEDVRKVAEGIGPASSAVGLEDGRPKLEVVKSFGEQITEHERFKELRAKGFVGSWSTGVINLESPGVGAKTTLVEGDNLFLEGGTPGAGAALVPLDQRPGTLPILFQQNRVASLFASGTTASNAINYVVESTATSGAAVVAEGGTKPESTLAFDNAQETVKKIATWIPVSDEMLEDAPALQSYINARLTLFVQNEEDEQLLHGAGGSNFRGLLPRIPAANRYVTSSVTAANNADHIYEAITVARRSFLEPDGIVVNPEDWADLRLAKDGNDNYMGGSPFSNTGNGEPGESLWGKRVVMTYGIPAGTAVVGAFNTAAQLFRKGGLSVEATNSHSDYFVKNLTAIRCEVREALAVYRPSAFAIADIGYPS